MPVQYRSHKGSDPIERSVFRRGRGGETPARFTAINWFMSSHDLSVTTADYPGLHCILGEWLVSSHANLYACFW